MGKQIPTIRANMTGAIKRAHINGWKEDKNKSGFRHFLFCNFSHCGF